MRKFSIIHWVLIVTALNANPVLGADDRAEDPFATAIKGLLFNVIEQELRKSETESKPDVGEPKTNFNQKTPLEPTAIQILQTNVVDSRAIVKGRIAGSRQPTQVLISGQAVMTDANGFFTYETYIPVGVTTLVFTVTSATGSPMSQIVNVERKSDALGSKLRYSVLNPTERPSVRNENAVALVVGVAEYSNVAPAQFADRDAQVFYDYAHLKLGIPRSRIQVLLNDQADIVGLLSGINKWLKRSVRQGESDVYLFFAGHGLASDDGGTAYLIPHDGAPDFLSRTALSRDEVFQDVASVKPRSVTVFLDTCYSGDTRGEDRLIAGRPLAVKLKDQSLPAGFTVLTAAGGDQIAKPLEEAEHGLFSYYLMKGMEGDADANNDGAITASELHSFVRNNVVQQSGGSQVPELQGDTSRVLVRFQ